MLVLLTTELKECATMDYPPLVCISYHVSQKNQAVTYMILMSEFMTWGQRDGCTHV